jgi:adenylyltransferase/sulfurtransferase
MFYFEVTPSELNEEIKSGGAHFLLDVREANELEISVLPNVVHIPLGEIADRINEIPLDENVVVICRSGARSGRVVEFLKANGYERVRNLATGMNGWATTVDPNIPTY